MRGLRIGHKLISGFAICIILSATIGAGAVINLARIRKDTTEIKIATDIEKLVLECRRQEKNIMLFGPYEKEKEILGEEEKAYLEKVNDNLVAFKSLVEKGKKIAAAAEEEEESNAMLMEIENYEISLKAVVADYKEREEIIGKLEANSERLRRLGQAETKPEEIISIVSELHGRMHHYITYRDIQYIDEVKSEITALKEIAENEELTKLADEYLALSNRLVENTERINSHNLSMRKNGREIQKIAQKIIGIAEKRIATSYRMARGIVWTTLILAIVFGGGVGVFLSRSIANPLIDITTVTDAVAKGDLSQRIKIKARGEIGDLAKSFNRMTEDLSKSRDKIIEARDYTDNIIKSMIDTLIVVDPEANIKTINRATSDILGYREDELIGQPVATIFAEEEEEEEEEEESIFKGTRLKKLIQEGTVRDYDMKYRTKKGEIIPVSFSGSVMRDKDGELVGIVGIARDIREIKRLMQKEKELAAAAAAVEAEKKRAVEQEEAYRELREKSERLERFHRVAVDQELEMVRLEEEVNNLLQELGQPKKYEAPEKIQKSKERKQGTEGV